MTGDISFPIPFKSLRTMSGGRQRAYVVGTMFTAGYVEKANRLAASCEKLGLPYVMHEVPTVHRSISSKGSDDLSYTKPNFIRHLLAANQKPVLYVDADCEIVRQPELIDQLVNDRCDFAIYNGFADEETDRFVPVEVQLAADGPPIKDRFYRFSGGARWYTESQLACSGCVQLYRNSFAARALLAKWHRAIATFPGCADDPCLDFVFNNLTKSSWLSWFLKTRWLPKSYARYAWWIQAEPVINHPEIPGTYSGFIPIKDPGGRKRFYQSRMQLRNPCTLFPRDCIIDTQEQMVCELVDGQVVPIKPTGRRFWL